MVLNEEVNIVKKSNGSESSIGTDAKGKSKPIIESVLRLL